MFGIVLQCFGGRFVDSLSWSLIPHPTEVASISGVGMTW